MQARSVYGVIGAQYEPSFGVEPSTPDLTQIYFETEGFKASQNQIESKVKTGSRHPTEPIQGNIGVAGSIATELGAYPGLLFVAASGSVKTEANAGTGEVVGAALTTPAAVIDAYGQTLTISAVAHGIAVGDVVKIESITAPTSLNSTYVRCMSVTSADVFVCRIPLRVSGAFTLGAGTVKKVTTPATTYKHTIVFGGRLPSLLIEKGFPDIGQYFKYSGCVCGKMALQANTEGVQNVTFDFTGKNETAGSTSFDAAITDLGKVSFSAFQGTIEEGGATIAIVTKVSFALDNQLDAGGYVFGGQGLRRSILEGQLKISGSIEALFEDLALYNKAKNFTTSALKIPFTRGTGAGTSGNEYFELYVPNLKYARDAPTIGGEGGVMVTLPFGGFLASGATETVTITLKNTQLAI